MPKEDAGGSEIGQQLKLLYSGFFVVARIDFIRKLVKDTVRCVLALVLP